MGLAQILRSAVYTSGFTETNWVPHVLRPALSSTNSTKTDGELMCQDRKRGKNIETVLSTWIITWLTFGILI
jgi:hypothetical protein